MSKPLFIGIGVQKCASTWIHRILEDHPQVSVSSPKELDFFSYHYHFGFEWYEKHFSSSVVAGENSPSYFCDHRVPERVYKYNPQMKIIICLRDPVARVVSHHSHEVRLGHVDAHLTYQEALKNNPMYVDQSMYASYLKVWLAIFPKNQVLILLQEDIQKTPKIIAKEVYRFLDVDIDFQSSFLDRKANQSQVPQSESLESILKNMARCMRTLGLDSVIKKIKDIAWVQAVRQSNMQDIRETLPEMSGDDLAYLDQLFKQDMNDLAQMTQLDLNVWPTRQRCMKSDGMRE